MTFPHPVTRGGYASDVGYVAGPEVVAWTKENQIALVAWGLAEGTLARFNPQATTLWVPGESVQFNSAGVVSYSSLGVGISAFLATLKNGLYGGVLAALKTGKCACAVAEAVGRSPWGTGNFTPEVEMVAKAPTRYLPQLLPSCN